MGLSLALLGLLSLWEGEIVIPVLVSGSPCPPVQAAVEEWGVGVTLYGENRQDNSWLLSLLLTPGFPASSLPLRDSK